MTMPALATRASTLLFLSCGHKLVCVAIAKHSRIWVSILTLIPYPVHIQWGPIKSLFFAADGGPKWYNQIGSPARRLNRRVKTHHL